MFNIKSSSLTLQKLHLGLFGVDTDGIDALGGCNAALDVVSCQGVENARFPSPIQAQHQDLLTVSFTLQSEGQHTYPGQPEQEQSLAGLGERRRLNKGSGGHSKGPSAMKKLKKPAGFLRHKRTVAAMGESLGYQPAPAPRGRKAERGPGPAPAPPRPRAPPGLPGSAGAEVAAARGGRGGAAPARGPGRPRGRSPTPRPRPPPRRGPGT